MYSFLHQSQWLILIRILLGMGFVVAALFRAGLTLSTLILLIAVYLLSDGIVLKIASMDWRTI